MKRFALPLLAAVSFALVGSAYAQGPTLDIGMKAPALKVEKWLKGTPVTGFEDGKIYVVEYWATWCPPCKESIPHLTKMAKKLAGKVTFVGVSIWEKDWSLPAPFVEQMGDKMDYNIAVDGPTKFMDQNWMRAAGENGIPCAFIIDGKGTIAWIGHPMSMEKTLDEVVAGKYDPKPYAKARAERIAKKIKQDATFAPYRAAMKAKDKAKALAELEKIEKESPEFSAEVAGYKLPLLAELDPAKAAKLVKDNLNGAWKNDIGTLYNAAMMFGAPTVAKPNYEIAIKCIDRVLVLGKDKFPFLYDAAAGMYFRNGNQSKAVELEEKAIKLAEADPKGANMVPGFKANLETFKKGKTD